MEEQIWFYLVSTLRRGRDIDVLTIGDVARATGRTSAAVKAALADGRLPRASAQLPPGVRSITLIRATPDELTLWRLKPLDEELAERPELPQRIDGWISQAELARELGVSSWDAHAIIRRLAPLRLEWGSGPFRPEIRYWIPCREAIAAVLRGLR